MWCYNPNATTKHPPTGKLSNINIKVKKPTPISNVKIQPPHTRPYHTIPYQTMYEEVGDRRR